MFGRSVWGQGDIWIMNDAYLTGTHMHDVTVFAPIFYHGDLAGFAASRAHWLDIGAKDPGVPMDSVEIFQEGVRLPPTMVVRNGEPVQDIWDIIEANVRFPRSAIGDMTAQFAVASIGEHRLGALFDRYGRDTVEAAAEEIFRQSEQLDREAIRAIPDGEYTAEGFLDSDGVGDDPVRIKVRITWRASACSSTSPDRRARPGPHQLRGRADPVGLPPGLQVPVQLPPPRQRRHLPPARGPRRSPARSSTPDPRPPASSTSPPWA